MRYSEIPQRKNRKNCEQFAEFTRFFQVSPTDGHPHSHIIVGGVETHGEEEARRVAQQASQGERAVAVSQDEFAEAERGNTQLNIRPPEVPPAPATHETQTIQNTSSFQNDASLHTNLAQFSVSQKVWQEPQNILKPQTNTPIQNHWTAPPIPNVVSTPLRSNTPIPNSHVSSSAQSVRTPITHTDVLVPTSPKNPMPYSAVVHAEGFGNVQNFLSTHFTQNPINPTLTHLIAQELNPQSPAAALTLGFSTLLKVSVPGFAANPKLIPTSFLFVPSSTPTLEEIPLKTGRAIPAEVLEPWTNPLFAYSFRFLPPNLFQKLEKALLKFSNLLFGQYLLLPQAELSAEEMLYKLGILWMIQSKKEREKKEIQKQKEQSLYYIQESNASEFDDEHASEETVDIATGFEQYEELVFKDKP